MLSASIGTYRLVLLTELTEEQKAILRRAGRERIDHRLRVRSAMARHAIRMCMPSKAPSCERSVMRSCPTSKRERAWWKTAWPFCGPLAVAASAAA